MEPEDPGAGTVSQTSWNLPKILQPSKDVLVTAWFSVLFSLFVRVMSLSLYIQCSAVSAESEKDRPLSLASQTSRGCGVSCTHLVSFLRSESKVRKDGNHVF